MNTYLPLNVVKLNTLIGPGLARQSAYGYHEGEYGLLLVILTPMIYGAGSRLSARNASKRECAAITIGTSRFATIRAKYSDVNTAPEHMRSLFIRVLLDWVVSIEVRC